MSSGSTLFCCVNLYTSKCLLTMTNEVHESHLQHRCQAYLGGWLSRDNGFVTNYLMLRMSMHYQICFWKVEVSVWQLRQLTMYTWLHGVLHFCVTFNDISRCISVSIVFVCYNIHVQYLHMSWHIMQYQYL